MKKFYSVKSSDNEIRVKSSSGGVFLSIAKNIIKNDGVVYGAIYDKNLNVVHSRADNLNDLLKMSGSKYCQSQLGTVFEEVKKDLENGKKVLFSGTPCQIKSLNTIIKNNIDNLYTIDLVCHGTPKKEYLADYISYQENRLGSKMVDINMRYKCQKEYDNNLKRRHIYNGPVEHKMMITMKNGKKYIFESEFDAFYQLFDYFINEGCFKCPFANLDRVSDITIGDFHEFNSELGDFNDGNGVSLVITNTLKGEILLKKIESTLVIVEKNMNECIQPALERPTIPKKDYKSFTEDYKKFGFEYVVRKYGRHGFKYNMKRILHKLGILKIIKNINLKGIINENCSSRDRLCWTINSHIIKSKK